MVNDARGSLRIKENMPVNWQLLNSDRSGLGKILNISTTGALLEINNLFPIPEDSVFKLDSLVEPAENFVPQQGRVVWSEVKNNERIVCGLKFVEPLEDVLAKLRERIQAKIMETTNKRKIKSVAGVVLFVAMLAMVGYILQQQNDVYRSLQDTANMMVTAADKQAAVTRTYINLYHETQNTLTQVTTELDSTKALLKQTEDLLAQSKQENEDLKNKMAALQSQDAATLAQSQAQLNQTRTNMEQQISALNEKNNQFASELTALKDQMRVFEGDVKSIDEGKNVIALFKNKLDLVRTKMTYLRREAHFARISAQKERDRLLLMQGNQGFLAKDGQWAKPENEAAKKKDVNIDVTFVE